jgi:hypothetical protein
MTLSKLLHLLRVRLLKAIDENDRELLVEMKITFTILKEVIYDSENEALIALLVELEDAAQDSVMGVAWKSDVPTDEAIETALSTAS